MSRAVFLVLVLLLGTVQIAAEPASSKRYRELTRTVDKNAGHAHMTRGANMCTILALSEEASRRPEDIPLLGQMLSDRDQVFFLAARSVLATRGSAGRAALESFKRTLPEHHVRLREVARAIEEAERITASLDGYRRQGLCRIRK
jgi:hypothetical protein